MAQRARLEMLLHRTIRVQEEERKRLSLELHDSPVQWLTSAIYRLEAGLQAINKGRYQETGVELRRVQDALDKTLTELRSLTASLHPPELEKVGLAQALLRHVDAFQRATDIAIHFKLQGSIPRLSAASELAFYRVAQEALFNVRKHSKATAVQVELKLDKDSLNLVITDNGIGFEVQGKPRTLNGHLGLAGMEERARMLGGSFSIQSRHGAGTRITLRVPLQELVITQEHPEPTVVETVNNPAISEVAA
jgi:signal transduction histidine kinase